MTSIHFGTDGWRGIIAEDFTVANVRAVARAIGRYLLNSSKASPAVTLGYDTRFESDLFAQTVAEELASCGIRVIKSDGFVSTPALSSSVVEFKAAGGIMISASHNPPQYNGIKFKTPQGGSAPETVTKEFEANLKNVSSPLSGRKGSVQTKDLVASYLDRVKAQVDFRAIKKARVKVVADPLYGAGIGYLKRLLEPTNISLTEIHSHPDPLFGGLHPEPIEEYLADLKQAVRRTRAAVGLATDGDADRIGVVDDKGNYLTPHQVFPLLLYYLCKYKRMRGKVVQAISLGYVSERIAKDFGLAFEEVPVGFKNIAQRILSEKILVGGEESGGYGYGTYLPERDGILNSLMLLEMIAVTGKPVSSLLNEIRKNYGASSYLRTDLKNPGIPKDEFVSVMKREAPGRIAGLAVKEIKDYDGVEFVLEDDSWLLLRPSGTEPIIRVYSESEDVAKTKRIIAWGRSAVRRV